MEPLGFDILPVRLVNGVRRMEMAGQSGEARCASYVEAVASDRVSGGASVALHQDRLFDLEVTGRYRFAAL
jgi:hypothetical protein